MLRIFRIFIFDKDNKCRIKMSKSSTFLSILAILFNLNIKYAIVVPLVRLYFMS